MELIKITDNIFCLQSLVFSIYVIKSQKNALIELGISQTAPEIIYDLKNKLNIENIDCLISTHSHFDHIGGATRLKKFFENSLLYASPYTNEVFKNNDMVDIYRTTMEKISRQELFYAVHPNSDKVVEFDKLEIDVEVKEGDELNLGELTLKFLELPGHSKCCIGVWYEKENIVFITDSAGAPLPSGKIWPTCYYDVNLYKNSINKIINLNPRIICLGHIGCMKGNEAIKFLQRSLKTTDEYLDLLKQLLKEKADNEEEVHKVLFAKYRDDLFSYIQPNIFKYGNREMLKQIKLKI